MNSKWNQFTLFALVLVFIAGCGFQLTPFFTPAYKNPPGYSETYKKRLLGEPVEGSSTRTEKQKDGFIQNQPSYLPPTDAHRNPMGNVRDSEESQNSGSSSRNM